MNFQHKGIIKDDLYLIIFCHCKKAWGYFFGMKRDLKHMLKQSLTTLLLSELFEKV